MYTTYPFSRVLAEWPEFTGGPGLVRMRVLDCGHHLIAAGMHGDPDGFISIEVVVMDEWDEEQFSYHADVTPQELTEMVREWTGDTRPVSIAPCYPNAVRGRYGDTLTILGDWDGSTVGYWGEGIYCPEPK